MSLNPKFTALQKLAVFGDKTPKYMADVDFGKYMAANHGSDWVDLPPDDIQTLYARHTQTDEASVTYTGTDTPPSPSLQFMKTPASDEDSDSPGIFSPRPSPKLGPASPQTTPKKGGPATMQHVSPLKLAHGGTKLQTTPQKGKAPTMQAVSPVKFATQDDEKTAPKAPYQAPPVKHKIAATVPIHAPVQVQAPKIQLGQAPDPLAPRKKRAPFVPFWKPTVKRTATPRRYIRRKDPVRDWEKEWRLASGWGSRTWGLMAENVGEVQVRARRRRQKYIIPFPEDYP